MTNASELKTTPLNAFHEKFNASMVDFAGWSMPIRYDSIIKEHQFVRSKIGAGLFDVSHMGRLWLEGPGARKCLEYVLSRYVSAMEPGQCRYAIVCNQAGGTIDDVIVSKFELGWMLVVNASNREKVVAHIENAIEKGGFKVRMADRTLTTAMVALQGELVVPLMDQHVPGLSLLKRYQFLEAEVLDCKMIISRTGYTGEDGVEVILPAGQVEMLMNQLDKYLDSDNGDALSELENIIPSLGLHTSDFDGPIIRPIGLGARDTLRMEAGMPLYGHELEEDISPLEAGLKFAVKLNKHETDRVQQIEGESFCGEKTILGQGRKLIGLAIEGRRSARQGAKVLYDGKQIGIVTSGCFSPSLNQPIAMGLINPDGLTLDESTVFDIDLGNTQIKGKYQQLPFIKK